MTQSIATEVRRPILRGTSARPKVESRDAMQQKQAALAALASQQQSEVTQTAPDTQVKQSAKQHVTNCARLAQALQAFVVNYPGLASLIKQLPGVGWIVVALGNTIGEKLALPMVAKLVAGGTLLLFVTALYLLPMSLFFLGYQVVNVCHWGYRQRWPELDWQVKLHCAIAKKFVNIPLIKEKDLEELAKTHTFAGRGALLADALNAEYMTRRHRSLSTLRRTINPKLCSVNTLPVDQYASKNEKLAEILFKADQQEDALPFALNALRQKPAKKQMFEFWNKKLKLKKLELWKQFCNAAIACESVNALLWAKETPDLPDEQKEKIDQKLERLYKDGSSSRQAPTRITT